MDFPAFPFPVGYAPPALQRRVRGAPTEPVPMILRKPPRHAGPSPWKIVWALPTLHPSTVQAAFDNHRRKCDDGTFPSQVVTGDLGKSEPPGRLVVVNDPATVPAHVLRETPVIICPSAFPESGEQPSAEASERHQTALRAILQALEPACVIAAVAPDAICAANDVGVPLLVEWWFGTVYDAGPWPSDLILSAHPLATETAKACGRRPLVEVVPLWDERERLIETLGGYLTERM